MNITKFGLRDLFWLMLIIAIGAGWGIERSKALGRWGELQKNPGVPPNDMPERKSNPQLVAAIIQGLSREELLAELQRPIDAPTFDMHLLEAIRRGWKDELTIGYSERMHPSKRPEYEWKKRGFLAPLPEPNPATILNGEYLTALRRVEGKPDPLKISVRCVGKDAKGHRVSYPYIIPKIENVDVDKERCNYVKGGIGERHPQWKLKLTNEQGVVMEAASYMPVYPPRGPAVLTESHDSLVGKHFLLDARAYVKPPPTGRYLLELIYSNRDISREHDFSHRIVWKSEPIPVIVTNRNQESQWKSMAVPLVMLGLAVIAMLVTAAVTIQKRQVARRNDWLALAIVAILAVGWIWNIYSIKNQIERWTYDSNANWTMELAK
jgi:hypothetical protein